MIVDWDEQLERARHVLRMDGQFIGSLNDEEYNEACFLIEHGYARREFRGAGGLMGLAIFRITEEGRKLLNRPH